MARGCGFSLRGERPVYILSVTPGEILASLVTFHQILLELFVAQCCCSCSGGAAEACGIVPGDRLITIDGVNVASSLHYDVTAFIQTRNVQTQLLSIRAAH